MKMETKSEHFYICVIKWNEMRFCGIYVCGALILFMWNGNASASFLFATWSNEEFACWKRKFNIQSCRLHFYLHANLWDYACIEQKMMKIALTQIIGFCSKQMQIFWSFFFHVSGTRVYTNGLGSESESESKRAGVHYTQKVAYTHIN